MKKLIMLTILLLVSWQGFSQIVTKGTQDTLLPLKTPIVRLVIKDLIKGDGAIAEVEQLNEVIKLKDDQILLLTQKDSLKTQENLNLQTIILKKDNQFAIEEEKSKKLLKELRGQRRKTFLFKVGTFIGVVTSSALLIK